MSSSLVVQTSFIGDVILSTPLIAKLAESGDVDVITTPVGATVLANNPDIRHLWVYDKRGTDRGALGLVRTAIRARTPLPTTMGVMQDVVPSDPTAKVAGRGGAGWSERASGAPRLSDTAMRNAYAPASESRTTQHHPDRGAYLAQGSIRSAALALAAGYEQRTGFDTSNGRILYTHQVRYREDWHHARRLLSLADEEYATTVPDTGLQPHLYPSIADVAAVDKLLQGRNRPFVVIAPGSAWETKRWPYYGELGHMLSQEWDVAIVGGKDDADSATDILRRLPAKHVIDAMGKLSLLGSSELIGRARVVIGNDSAPQHLASAMRTPTVTVFGPTVPDFGFGPLAPRSRVVGRDGLSCRPCDRHGPRRCPLGHWKCMREVPAMDVYDAVIKTMRQEVTQ